MSLDLLYLELLKPKAPESIGLAPLNEGVCGYFRVAEEAENISNVAHHDDRYLLLTQQQMDLKQVNFL